MKSTARPKGAISRGTSRNPTFHTAEEEAVFWDARSTTEFEDEFETVEDIRFVVRRAGLQQPLTVRLPADHLAGLREHARRLGVRPAALARLWLLERLHAERTGDHDSPPAAGPKNGPPARGGRR